LAEQRGGGGVLVTGRKEKREKGEIECSKYGKKSKIKLDGKECFQNTANKTLKQITDEQLSETWCL